MGIYRMRSQRYDKPGVLATGQVRNDFGSNGISAPFYPPTVNPAAYCYNGRTYVAWQGDSGLDPYVSCYDHVARTWAVPVKCGTSPLIADDHGAPAIIVDNSGYIHVFFGVHTGDHLLHTRSTNPENINAWTAQASIDGIGAAAVAYPNLIKTAGGVLYLILRTVAGVDNGKMEYRLSTDYTTAFDIINFGADTNIYTGNAVYDSANGRVWLAWCYYSYISLKRLNVYAAYLKLSDGHMYSVDGTDLGTTVDVTEGTDHCLVHDSGVTETQIPALSLSSAGVPYIVYNTNESGTATHVHQYWTGAAWDAQETIVVSNNMYNMCDLKVNASGTVDAYVCVGPAAGHRSGHIEWWQRSVAGAWTKQSTLLNDATSLYMGYNEPHVVVDGTAVRVVCCETDDAVYTHWDLRVFGFDANGNMV